MTNAIRFTALGCVAAGCALFHGCASDPTPPAAPASTPVYVEPVVAVAAAVLPETYAYVVQKGDMLSSILKRSETRMSDIMALNPGLKPDRIYPGQTIQLPVTANIAALSQPITQKAGKPAIVKDGDNLVYTVAKGDALSLIAQRFGVKTQALRDANELKSDTIRVGQKLLIPSPTKTPAL